MLPPYTLIITFTLHDTVVLCTAVEHDQIYIWCKHNMLHFSKLTSNAAWLSTQSRTLWFICGVCACACACACVRACVICFSVMLNFTVPSLHAASGYTCSRPGINNSNIRSDSFFAFKWNVQGEYAPLISLNHKMIQWLSDEMLWSP